MIERSHAYTMYNLGDGTLWNEIDFMTNVLNDPEEKYKVHAIQINKVEYDKDKEELKLELGKIGNGSYPFIFFYESIINKFLNDSGIEDIEKIQDLEQRRLIGLFSQNELKWIVACNSITQDEKLENLLETN